MPSDVEAMIEILHEGPRIKTFTFVKLLNFIFPPSQGMQEFTAVLQMLDKFVSNLFHHVILLQRLCGSSLNPEPLLSSAALGSQNIIGKVTLYAKDVL